MKPGFTAGARMRHLPSTAARVLAIAACGFMLSGCTTVRGWFSDDKEDPTEPVELNEITPTTTAP
jgi:ABC-type uncharacterized transport system auxiliary subunit